MEVLVRGLGGEVRGATVADPLGRPVEASFAVFPDRGTAVAEMAQASGLALVAEEERDAWAATSRGTGELIVAAARAGARRVIVAVGGSATSDGGAGAFAALEEAGPEGEVELELLCDVRVPWEGAARVFGPQKGADRATIARLERRLDELAGTAPRDPRGVPMTGAGGGLAGGLWAFRGARLVPGAAYVLDALGFDARMRAARCVVAGEGRLDQQSLLGKAVGEIGTRWRQAGVPLHAIVGQDAMDGFSKRMIDLHVVEEATTLEAMSAAAARLGAALRTKDA